MAKLSATQASTTNVAGSITEFSVDSAPLDAASDLKETVWDFTDAAKNIGYYKDIPELKAVINTLATWTVGKGYEPEKGDTDLKQIIEHLSGWGEDTFQSIMWNLVVMKKIVGDSFAEIIKRDGVVINIKVISPERMRVVVGRNGMIKRYEVLQANGKWKKMSPEDILHLCNDRIGDEIHGTSMIDSLKWVIDARNEALVDEKMIKHRELALGVLYVDTDDAAKREKIKTAYKDAVTKGEVLVLPKDLAELKDSNVSPKERLEWIRYLENFFYQASGVPRILTTSEGATEAGGKVGYLTFEPIYTREQTDLEADIWNQIAWVIKFNRPASLGGTIQQDEAKNTGQVGFQPNDVEATVTPE